MTICGLCGQEFADLDRCPACAMAAGFGPNRQSPFKSGILWAMAGALTVIYAATLTVVVITR